MLNKNIVAHRGFWKNIEEKNSLIALERALDHGFGVETDIRDFNGSLVISHGLPSSSNCLEIKDFLNLYSKHSNSSGLIALNVKSDGLGQLIKTIFGSYNFFERNVVMFDMSVPETFFYKNISLPFLVRLSEYETLNSLENYAEGYWVDNFGKNYTQINISKNLLKKNKKVVFVSPELHNLQHENIWNEIRVKKLHLDSNFFICTDFPAEALSFFEHKND